MINYIAEIVVRGLLALILVPFVFMMVAFMAMTFMVLLPFIILFGEVTVDDVPLKEW